MVLLRQKIKMVKKSLFNLGPDNKWENNLDLEIRQKIEKSFSNEMKEIGYL